jgi:hypothetical protein
MVGVVGSSPIVPTNFLKLVILINQWVTGFFGFWDINFAAANIRWYEKSMKTLLFKI